MSFSDLNLDPADQALVDELKAAVRRPEYHLVPDQAFENLESDPQIPDEPVAGSPASRREFVNHLRANAQDRSEGCLLHGRAFCRAHQRRGQETGNGMILGHVQELSKLADWLHDAREDLSPKQVQDLLRDLVSSKADPAVRLQEQREKSQKPTLTRYQMWSFLTDDGRRPFQAISPRRAELLNFLGLGSIPPEAEVVYWTHSLPAGMAAQRPTVWDTDLDNPYWRPTGRTEPLDGSGSTNGFPEVVHPSVGVADLIDPIGSAES
ncbi:MAG TPA: hypothetical protein VFE33_03800 [Thermoanaerobaculia bacterium]|nr:hypothetical protein [Thermoanaerobaculia bacterium]